MEFLDWHPFAIFLGLAALAFGGAFYYNWKRRKDLGELAASMGLLFSPDGPGQGGLEASGLELFGEGHSRKASNLIEVPCGGGAIQFFDYKYRTGHGRRSSTHRFTLALLRFPLEVPEFDLKPENLFYKLGEILGFRDIDLPAFPEFSRQYRLTGPDEHGVRLFFTPGRAAWFERNPGLRVQGARGGVLYIRKAGLLPVSAWSSFIEEAKAFAAEILR